MPDAPREQRKLAAIMFTDMVGYSALTQRSEALALELLHEHRQLLRELFSKFGGREVETTGDGFLIEFSSALEASRCAIEIQRTLAARNVHVSSDRQIQVRIGIHVGDVVQREGQVLGDGVNIAARLQPLAPPGGICISVDVARQVQNALQASVARVGEAELKNIRFPMEVFRIVLPWERTDGPDLTSRAAKAELDRTHRPNRYSTIILAAVGLSVLALLAAAWFLKIKKERGTPIDALPGPVVSTQPSLSEQAKIRALAVKPLDDFSGDTNYAYLSDGMTEALCAALGDLSGLRVPARTTVMSYKGSRSSIQEMAKALHVDAILEGSIQHRGTNLLIRVQLIEAASDAHLWSATYDRDLSEFFKLQNEVAHDVAAKIQLRLSAQDQARLASAPTTSAAVIEAYLKGRFELDRNNQQAFERALLFFQQAQKLDPNFAKAYSGVADAYAQAMGWWVEDGPALALGIAAAAKAVALDPASAEAHASLGSFEMMSWHWANSEKEFQTALRLNDRYAHAYGEYGFLLLFTGRTEAGLEYVRRGLALNPRDPVETAGAAGAYLHTGHLEEAAQSIELVFQLDPNSWFACGLKSLLFALQGDFTSAIPWAERGAQLSKRNPDMLGNLGWIYGRSGDHAKAQSVLHEMQNLVQPRTAAPVHSCWVYIGLDEPDQAMNELKRGLQIRDPGFMFLNFDARFAPLRQDPRFQEIVKTIGLGP